MSTVKSIKLVLPEDEVYLAGSSIAGQLVLKLRSTLVDPVVKVELVGRGYLEWNEEENPHLDYSRSTVCRNQAIYVSKAQNFHVDDGWLDSGVHTFDFHFSFPPGLPSTFTSKIGLISYFIQGTCSGREIVLAKEKRYLLLQGTFGNQGEDASLMVEARKDAVYLCCFSHGSVILRIYLEKNIFSPGETIVFMTDISNRTCKYIRKLVFAVHCIVLYRGFNSRGEQRSLEDRSEVARLEFWTDTAPFQVMRVTSKLVLPKPLPVTSTLTENEMMSFRYELVGTSNLPCTTSTMVGRIPVIVAIPENISEEQSTMNPSENEGDKSEGNTLDRDISEKDQETIEIKSSE
ncbi:arrestin domain-containing protein 5 [Struthio camelus]|uniref:arrestin domain-containing protein 5 n=1 Tax=Struthio camelus TaxID=8801 RepID=UPI00051E3D28|nr:PREDICTED: arrestin domain-containing protein 5 [Struthio camelus australis]